MISDRNISESLPFWGSLWLTFWRIIAGKAITKLGSDCADETRPGMGKLNDHRQPLLVQTAVNRYFEWLDELPTVEYT